MKRKIVTYHCVFAIIHAVAATVRKSAAVRKATPVRKGLEAIFLHAPVERGSCEAERVSGAADVPAMRLERSLDRVLFHRIERGCLRWQSGVRRAGGSCRGEGEVARLEHFAFAQYDAALDGMAQGAYVARPRMGRQALERRRAQPLRRNVVLLRIDRDEVLEQQRNVLLSLAQRRQVEL